MVGKKLEEAHRRRRLQLPPSMPPELQALVWACTHWDPQQRWVDDAGWLRHNVAAGQQGAPGLGADGSWVAKEPSSFDCATALSGCCQDVNQVVMELPSCLCCSCRPTAEEAAHCLAGLICKLAHGGSGGKARSK